MAAILNSFIFGLVTTPMREVVVVGAVLVIVVASSNSSNFSCIFLIVENLIYFVYIIIGSHLGKGSIPQCSFKTLSILLPRLYARIKLAWILNKRRSRTNVALESQKI